MTFRLPFQISRVGALCRPANPDGLVSKLAARKGNLKKLILYQIKQDPSANLLQQCKYKTSYVPTRYNTTKTDSEFLMKPSPHKSVKKVRSNLVDKKCETNEYYPDEVNFGPNFNRGPTQAKSKITLTTTTKCNTTTTQEHTGIPKYDNYGMESFYDEIKDIDDKMNTPKPIISPPEPDIQSILPDAELKIQNDIWKQSGSEIINNLNSKNSIWRFISGKRKMLKHDFCKTAKMWTKLIPSPIPVKTSKSNKVQLGTKQYSYIYLPTKRKSVKLNLDKSKYSFGDKIIQQRLLHKTRKHKNNTEQKDDVEERFAGENPDEQLKENTLTSAEANAVPESLETKNVSNDSKYKISHLPLKLNASKMFVNQNKTSKINIKPNSFIKVDRKHFSKPNVIMATVYNRQLNNPSPEFMEQYSYNNSVYHMNAMQDMNNYNDFDFKYPKICYNPENDTYLLHNELVAEGVIPKENTSIIKTDKATVSLETDTSDKKIKSVTGTKLLTKAAQKEKPLLKAPNEDATKCLLKSANLEKLNEVVRDNKAKLTKIETTQPKKKEQKVRHKIKSTRIPKTLGEIYGVGKVPFLVEVSKPGQAKHKQYLVVIQLPESKSQETSENNTNSPIPLFFNTDFNSDLLKETLLAPHASITNCLKAKATPEQAAVTNKKHASNNVGNMIGLVKVKNKLLPLLELKDNKGFEPLLPTKLSQLIAPKMNKKDNYDEKTYSQHILKDTEVSKNSEDQPRIAASCSPSGKGQDRHKEMHDQLQKIMHTTEYMINQRKTKPSVICKHERHYSTLSRRYQTAKSPNYKIPPKVHHTNRTVEFQQKRNLSCVVCPCCGQYPCSCQCSPCGWYPCYSCRPQCCPKFKLDYCCPRGRWDCSIPIPPCRKIDAPYPSYGESMPMWCKEPTECFDYDQHILQPKNQVSPKIHLMEESIPKVTVVDPALERKCCRDKWCEPCYPHVDQRICFECPYKVPVDCCYPRGRPHCYCWPDRPCTRKPPPYRCFSDEDLEFPEVEVTEHDLARRFASDLYRRMGRKCKLPFTPHCQVQCDLRSGEPRPVYKHDPKGHCATTCIPPGAYPAPCTPVRIPPCQIPGCDTYINCCMPMEGIKKTRCAKRCCPQDCCGYCPKEIPSESCSKDSCND